MYNGVDYPQDYPYYEPTSNSSMNWQNQNSQQQGAHPQAPSHPSQLPQNQSARFNRFNGHHARDDQDHQSQELFEYLWRSRSYMYFKFDKAPGIHVYIQ